MNTNKQIEEIRSDSLRGSPRNCWTLTSLQQKDSPLLKAKEGSMLVGGLVGEIAGELRLIIERCCSPPK